MATATERVMAIDGDNTDNGKGKEGGRQAVAATMAMGRGTAQSTWAAHPTTGEKGMMVAMGHGLCVSLCVCRETTKNKVEPKKSQWFLELIDRVRLAIVKLADNMAGYK